MKSNILTDHTLIIDELERSIKIHNWNSILPFLPKGSYLVGGYKTDWDVQSCRSFATENGKWSKCNPGKELPV